ncbi:accelerated cell death 11 [Oryza brachyantha]|uniref:accelerated cell death 11 n=1 Tax=Oryza brachyantha TaxID=4533 RepID=UPI0003EAC87E|nr:accelerated cell death 11 [Oryza brachyantha]
MGSSEGDKPLRRIAASFEELEAVAKQQQPGPGAMEVGAFARACSNVSVLFGCLGIAFKFAEMDYVAKVDDLLEASKSISKLPEMVELDIQKGTVRQAGSHTRNLLRVKRGIDMVKILFEQILVTEGNSLRDAASKAYAQVFAPHHGWAIRKAVAAGMYALPSKSQLLKKLNEDENSAKVQMQNFVRASGPVILYVEDLFTSRNLGMDW